MREIHKKMFFVFLLFCDCMIICGCVSADQMVLQFSPKRKRCRHVVLADKPPVCMRCDWSLQFVLAIGACHERNGLGFMVDVCGFEPNLSIWHFSFHAHHEPDVGDIMCCWKGSHFVFGSVFGQRVMLSTHIRISLFIMVNRNIHVTQVRERDGGLHLPWERAERMVRSCVFHLVFTGNALGIGLGSCIRESEGVGGNVS